MKKLSALLLILCLCCSCALAAPVRDARDMAVEEDDNLSALVSLMGGAVLMRDVSSLSAGETPSQPLVEGALLLGLFRFVLPRVDEQPLDDVETVPVDILKTYYRDLFASGEFEAWDAPQCPCITRTDGSAFSFDFSDLEDDSYGGAKIYEITKSGNDLIVRADLYSSIGNEGVPAGDVPQSVLFWESGITLELQPSSASRFGYQVVSLTTTPAYENGAFSEWNVTEGEGYSMSLPQMLEDKGGDVYQSADGLVTLRVETITDTRSDRLSYYLEQYQSGHIDARVLAEADMGYFTGETDGEYTICFANEYSDSVYLLTLTFPAERQAEFSFYGEIIRNSFYGYGLAMG